MSLDFADLPFWTAVAAAGLLGVLFTCVLLFLSMWATAAVTRWWLGTRADAIELIESARRAGAGDE